MKPLTSIKQRPSLLTWFLIFILLVLLLIAALRLAPAYVEHQNVVAALHSLQTDPSVRLQQQANDPQNVIPDIVLKRLVEKGVVSVKKNNIQLFYAKNGDIFIRVIYFVHIPIVGNIGFTLPFNDGTAVKK